MKFWFERDNEIKHKEEREKNCVGFSPAKIVCGSIIFLWLKNERKFQGKRNKEFLKSRQRETVKIAEYLVKVGNLIYCAKKPFFKNI